jgi:hypothetical protein
MRISDHSEPLKPGQSGTFSQAYRNLRMRSHYIEQYAYHIQLTIAYPTLVSLASRYSVLLRLRDGYPTPPEARLPSGVLCGRVSSRFMSTLDPPMSNLATGARPTIVFRNRKRSERVHRRRSALNAPLRA